MLGALVIAKALKEQGVTCVFGIVAEACRLEGIKFIAMRNEQGAAYAANAWGYLTGTPGVCLVVSGPGFVHALSGLSNAQSNGWPMLLLAGSSDVDQESKGAFQEFPQVEAARLYTKYAARPPSIEAIPFFVEKAMRTASYGRPGASYIDLPGNMITGMADEERLTFPKLAPTQSRQFADPVLVQTAVRTLVAAKKPLIIVGKGAALSRGSEVPLDAFLAATNIPFLPTPMGKGLIPDDHVQSVAAARSDALKEADVILLVGARLNWILHFGEPPRFKSDVRFIQVDVCPEEIGNNCTERCLGLVGDVSAVVMQLNEALKQIHETVKIPAHSNWWNFLNGKAMANKLKIEALGAGNTVPMNYYQAYRIIKKYVPRNAILVNEGANTMDIGRTMIEQYAPRSRIDAGTFGTMGLGFGFAIAAQLVHPDKRVFCIQGDSAFGFSAMEMETVCRLKLPIVFIIVNNSGIYSGVDREVFDSGDVPSTALTPEAGYEKIAEAFGAKGVKVKSPEELDSALKSMVELKQPAIINCIISTNAQRKQQEFSWLTRATDANL